MKSVTLDTTVERLAVQRSYLLYQCLSSTVWFLKSRGQTSTLDLQESKDHGSRDSLIQRGCPEHNYLSFLCSCVSGHPMNESLEETN